MTALRADHRVLVIALDEMAAALVGAIVDITGFQPEFARPGERPEDLVDRAGPVVALLLDAAHQAGGSDLLIARCRRRRIPAMLFGARTAVRPLIPWAEQHGVRTFTLPDEVDALHAALRELPPPDGERAS